MNRRNLMLGLTALGIGAVMPNAPAKLYIPQITISPDQFVGSQDYNCDHGEHAFANFYLSAPGVLVADWHYVNALGVLTFKSGQGVFQGPRVSSWFINKGNQRVVRLSWVLMQPGFFTDGSCLI